MLDHLIHLNLKLLNLFREEWRKVDLDEYNNEEKITRWVDRVLTNADDWDEAQRDLVEYVTDDLEDDEQRLMWTDVVQSF